MGNVLKHILKLTATRASVPVGQTEKVIALIEEGNTVPFIARYRKEATGSLDEVQIKAIEDSYSYVKSLNKEKKKFFALLRNKGSSTKT